MISTLLDTDLYKLTMQQAVWRQYPNPEVQYTFIERNRQTTYSNECIAEIRRAVADMRHIHLDEGERAWLATTGWLQDDYLEWLAGYRFQPAQVSIDQKDNQLAITVSGPWQSTILWEVPLLAIISECHHAHNDRGRVIDLQDYAKRSRQKSRNLVAANCHFADFGTRRRRSLEVQRAAIEGLIDGSTTGPGAFTGTSNLMLAREFGLKPVGTVAHEWIMALGAMKGIEHANRHALQAWLKVYEPEKTIALTDTYTIDLFLRDFDPDLAGSIAGLRQDSGDPFTFIDRFTEHYQSLGIDCRAKQFVFSDGLDEEKACAIQRYAEGKCQPSFGIGTHLTNDFPESPALDIVVKLTSCDGRPAVKTGENMGKATGEPQELSRVKNLISKLSNREL